MAALRGVWRVGGRNQQDAALEQQERFYRRQRETFKAVQEARNDPALRDTRFNYEAPTPSYPQQPSSSYPNNGHNMINAYTQDAVTFPTAWQSTGTVGPPGRDPMAGFSTQRPTDGDAPTQGDKKGFKGMFKRKKPKSKVVPQPHSEAQPPPPLEKDKPKLPMITDGRETATQRSSMQAEDGFGDESDSASRDMVMAKTPPQTKRHRQSVQPTEEMYSDSKLPSQSVTEKDDPDPSPNEHHHTSSTPAASKDTVKNLLDETKAIPGFQPSFEINGEEEGVALPFELTALTRDLINFARDLKSDHYKAKNQLRQYHRELKLVEEELGETEETLKKNRKQFEDAETELREVKRELNQYLTEITNLKKQQVVSVSQLEEQRREAEKAVWESQRLEEIHRQSRSDMKKDCDDRITRLKTEHEEVLGPILAKQAVHENDKADLQQKHDYDMKALQETFDHYKEEAEGTIATMDHENERKIAKLREENEAALKTMQRKKDKEIRDLQIAMEESQTRHTNAQRESIKNHEIEKSSLVGEHESRIDQQQARHERELKRLKEENDRQLSIVKSNHGMEVAELHKTHREKEDQWRQDVAQLRDQVQTVAAQAKATWTAEMERLEQQHKEEIAEKEEKLAQERESRAIEKASFDQNLQSQLQALQHRHKKDTQGLRKLVEKLKGDLADRDHFAGMSDTAIAERFEDLSTQVDQLARIPWDASREKTNWPYSEGAFRRSDNVRILKRDIVSNSIWIILDDRIFHTPFNMFGEEGLILDQKWTDAFSSRSNPPVSDYGPNPTKLSESWRFDTMRKCKQALEPGANRNDEDNDRNHGYQTTLDSTVEEIARVVGRVALLQDDKMKKIHQIAKAAAEFWLEVGSQRCRILVKVPKPHRDLLSSGRRFKGKVELIVKPELRRVGNSEGEELEKVETISGCEPQSNSFHPY